MLGAASFLAALLSSPGPYVLVNATGAPIEQLAIRPADEGASWRPLGPGSMPRNARMSMPSPGGDLCAFDLRGSIGGTVLTWSSVNLCDVKVVTLNRRPDGTLWVDYD